MSTNKEIIYDVIEYIDNNLKCDLSLDGIAKVFGYSKYHLHRMFSYIVGLSIHSYIKRRKLTEAARELTSTNTPIIDIALNAGYNTQQSFTYSFKKLYRKSPDKYRKKNNFMPIQLKFHIDENIELSGDRVIDINVVDRDKMTVVGYTANTAKGFWVIGQCHGKLEKVKMDIASRCDYDNIIGINDYANFDLDSDKKMAYDYYAAVEVASITNLPDGLVAKSMPATKYIVFSFMGKKKASTQHIVIYVYNKWFPQTAYQFNENAMYDFFKYNEATNDKGQSRIEYWIPVK